MRGVGQRVRDVCEALERKGSMTCTQICMETGGVDLSNVATYCKRAIALGLVTVKAGTKKPRIPDVYTVEENWRDVLERHETPASKSRWQGVNSVFAMGGV